MEKSYSALASESFRLRAWRLTRRALASWLLAALLACVLPASQPAAQTPVDVELVIAVDVSLSMDLEEQRLQRDGYVAAFRDAELHKAIAAGVHGRIAVVYMEWAGPGSQSVVIPWTVIDGPTAARAFADRFAIPVVEQWSPTNALATDHPMHAGFDPGELLGEADVVLVLDVPVPWVPSRQRPAASAAVIQIGPDPNFVDLPLRGHPATLAITSAVEPALESLGAALDRRLHNGVAAAELHPGASGATASAAAAPLRSRHGEAARRIAAMTDSVRTLECTTSVMPPSSPHCDDGI